MASPPSRTDLAGTPTVANYKLAIGALYDYVASLLGNGTATIASETEKKLARENLGVGQFGFKNRLINGSFLVDQRSNGGASTITAGTAIKYTADRWYATCAGANITVQRIEGINDNQYSLRLTGASSNSAVMIGQRIESSNCYDLKNKDVTVSLNAKSTSARTLTWSAYYANSEDLFSSKTTIATGTFDVTTSVEKFIFTFSAGSNAGNGLAIEFSGGALLAGSTIDFDAVQLEASSVATEFEYRSEQQDLSMCQRYCQVAGSGWAGGFDLTNRLNVGGSYLVAMRVAPTVSLLFTGLTARSSNGTPISSSTTIATSYIGTGGAVVVMDGWIGGTANAAATMVTNPWLRLVAEL